MRTWVIGLLGLMGAVAQGGMAVESDPLRWAEEPHARVSHTITMAVEPLPDAEYRFLCKGGDGPGSSWQTTNTFTAQGLRPETEYTYQAEARRAADQRPLRCPSLPVTVKTRAARSREGHTAAIDAALTAGRIELIPLQVTGDKDNRINIVLVNRWQAGQKEAYNTPERREEFIADARHCLGAFLKDGKEAVPPFPAYRDFFNVWAIWWPNMPPWNPEDRAKGMHWGDYNEIRDRLFRPWQRDGKGWVTHLAMFNGSGGGGGAGRILDQRIGDAMIVGNEIHGFIHEFSHTALSIPDEYTSAGTWGRGGEGATTTSDYRRDRIKWRKWIEPGTPVPTPYRPEYQDVVGAFEGGVHRMAFLFRPTARGCIMGAGSFAGDPEGLCPVCRQQAVQQIYRWVDPIDVHDPDSTALSIKGPGTLRFSVRRIAPEPDTQKTEWRLNGRVIGGNVDAVEVAFGPLKEYELVFALVDESPYVRPDPPHAAYPRAEVRWTIRNTSAVADTTPLRVSLTPRDPVFAGQDDGAIAVTVEGGKAPYTYAWDGGVTTKERQNLPAGTYALTVCDAEFRRASGTVALSGAALVTPELRSEWTREGWSLEMRGLNGDIACEWSNGQKGAAAGPVPDGAVACTLRHVNGALHKTDVLLRLPERPLSAASGDVWASSGGMNNGYARMVAEGGRPPYSVAWSDGHETTELERHFLKPGEYTVRIRDANRTVREMRLKVGPQPRFAVHPLKLEAAGKGVRIANAQAGLRYLWFEQDRPAHLPHFPHGIYTGTFTAPNGRVCPAEAFVVQNKGGLYVDERKEKNDFGLWVCVMTYRDGLRGDPVKVELSTRSQGQDPESLEIAEQKIGETAWEGTASDGSLVLNGTGPDGGTLNLASASHPDQVDRPLATGADFIPPQSGTFFVATQDTKTGAMSANRKGVSIEARPRAAEAAPLDPSAVRSAKLLLWLDAADLDGDGREDEVPPRRGAVMGWRGKAADVHFTDFVYFKPNTLNGKGVASWETIWIQGLNKPVSGYQTVVMVRREQAFSSPKTAPWRDLSPLIGVGAYGKTLMADDVDAATRSGVVYLNGEAVDPVKAPMPRDFYVVTYVFGKKIDRGFKQTDGHWEGDLAEVLVFDGPLDDAERRGLEEHLRRKWLSACDVIR